MNAREAMQALLEGKTLTAYGSVDYRLNDAGTIEQCGHTACSWNEYPTFMNNNPKIVEEYPLTFEQALREMLDGKIVAVENDPEHVYRFHNGIFEDCYVSTFMKWEQCVIYSPNQKKKWKVVDE